jgi:hypothetical protein
MGCSVAQMTLVLAGVPGGHDRALRDVPVNRAGLLRPVVDDPDLGGLDEFGPVVAGAELGFADAADHPGSISARAVQGRSGTAMNLSAGRTARRGRPGSASPGNRPDCVLRHNPMMSCQATLPDGPADTITAHRL